MVLRIELDSFTLPLICFCMFISRSVIVSPLTVNLTGILVLALQVSDLHLYYLCSTPTTYI